MRSLRPIDLNSPSGFAVIRPELAAGAEVPLDIATRLEKWIQSSNAAGSLPDLAITETIDEVIVYHADGLHMGVHDRRTNETESAMLEVPAECIGFG